MSQIERLSSKEMKMAARWVWIALGASGRSATLGMIVSCVGVCDFTLPERWSLSTSPWDLLQTLARNHGFDLVEGYDPVAACRLGDIKRAVRGGIQLVQTRATSDREARGYSYTDGLAVDGYGSLGDPLTEPLQSIAHARGFGFRADQAELLAAQARNQAKIRKLLAHDARDRRQGFVASGVPVLVIDALEPIDVGDGESNRAALKDGGGIVKGATVGEAGQRVRAADPLGFQSGLLSFLSGVMQVEVGESHRSGDGNGDRQHDTKGRRLLKEKRRRAAAFHGYLQDVGNCGNDPREKRHRRDIAAHAATIPYDRMKDCFNDSSDHETPGATAKYLESKRRKSALTEALKLRPFASAMRCRTSAIKFGAPIEPPEDFALSARERRHRSDGATPWCDMGGRVGEGCFRLIAVCDQHTVPVSLRSDLMGKVEKITIALTAEMAAFVREVVDSGDYASTSEAIRDAVREWKERRDLLGYTVEDLRELVREGLESPISSRSMAEVKAEARRRHQAKSARGA